MIQFNLSNLALLRQEMKKLGLAAYMIVTGDPHNSEEPAAYFAAERRFFCPFTGDNATVLITETKALLWTDGRFFISAEKELEGSTFELMRSGEKGVLTPGAYIKENNLSPLGTDLTYLSEESYKGLSKKAEIRDVSFAYLLSEKPALCKDKIWRFDDPKYQDLTAVEKFAKVMAKVKKMDADGLLVTTLDDIAYLTNLRGNDLHCTPLFYSYLYLEEGTAHLFVDTKRIDGKIEGVTLHEYEEIDAFVSGKACPILVDPSDCNAHLYSLIKKPIDGASPSQLMKAIKGPKEIENIISIQEEDGVALLKLIAYLDELGEKEVSEWDIAEVLHGYRAEGKRFLDESFPTIAAVGANAAMMHYGPTAETHSPVSKKCLELLVDSGGQYLGGTTDTTRTFLLGQPTEEYIHDYTLTLKSVIDLSMAKFLDGANSRCIDMLARHNMWKEGMDYKCGTGHGVGYLSVVHEGPNSFRYRGRAGLNDDSAIVPGMITTIEPGVYKKDKYGIRIENNILCVPWKSTSDGDFYAFKNVTFVPIETKAVDLSLLNEEELAYLNAYHQEVYEHLLPWVRDDERLLKVLKEKTKPLLRA